MAAQIVGNLSFGYAECLGEPRLRAEFGRDDRTQYIGDRLAVKRV